MPSILSTFTAALAFFAIVDASPVEIQKRKAFSVNQVKRKSYIKNGPKEFAKTLRKFGAKVPTHILDAATARTNGIAATQAAVNGSAPAVPADEYDSLYVYCYVSSAPG